jgi:hypothetical protein
MKAHKEMSVHEEVLPEGVVSVVEAVIPYLDEASKQKIEAQLLLFRTNQSELHQSAEVVAQRWLNFEMELADSLYEGYATEQVLGFIRQLSHNWSEDFRQKLDAHTQHDGRVIMTRELAIDLEESRRNTLWVSAAVSANNEKVISKMDSAISQKIYDNSKMIEMLTLNGYSQQEIMRLESENNQMAAKLNISVGGGCPGDSKGAFDDSEGISQFESSDDKSEWKWKKGVCVVDGCPTRPGQTKVGPCSVCAGCQSVYDHGGDPTKKYKPSVGVTPKLALAA